MIDVVIFTTDGIAHFWDELPYESLGEFMQVVTKFDWVRNTVKQEAINRSQIVSIKVDPLERKE